MKLLLTALVLLLVGGQIAATQEPAPPLTASWNLAAVNGYQITDSALLRWLRNRLPNLPNDPQSKLKITELDPALVKNALDYLINRRVVYEYLKENGLTISDAETRLELERFSNKLDQVGLSLVEYLDEQDLSQPEFEFELQWKSSWKSYLDRVLNDDYVKRHYDRHRPRFDRSEMQVAHLLLKVDEQRPRSEAVQKAETIRKQLSGSSASGRSPLTDNKTDGKPHTILMVSDSAWNQAVQEYSQAPSKSDNGQIGWIRFHEPMPESFSEAAFALQPGQVSPPVVTSFGVHLIRCRELKAGKVGWRDARAAVKDHAAKTLFEKIARLHRAKLIIQVH
jgi:parvulin-like peptidyl-prolyl isomerase